MHKVHRNPNNSKYVIIFFYDVLNSEILQVKKLRHTFLLYRVIKTQKNIYLIGTLERI